MLHFYGYYYDYYDAVGKGRQKLHFSVILIVARDEQIHLGE